MSKINELRAQRAKTWEQTKAFLDSHRSDKGVLSAEDTATYEKMEQEIVDLGREIERQGAFGRFRARAEHSGQYAHHPEARYGKGGHQDRPCLRHL